MSYTQIMNELTARGLDVSGTKKEQMQRLLLDDRSKSKLLRYHAILTFNKLATSGARHSCYFAIRYEWLQHKI